MKKNSRAGCLLSGNIDCKLFQDFSEACVKRGLYKYKALERIIMSAAKNNFEILGKIKKY